MLYRTLEPGRLAGQIRLDDLGLQRQVHGTQRVADRMRCPIRQARPFVTGRGEPCSPQPNPVALDQRLGVGLRFQGL